MSLLLPVLCSVRGVGANLFSDDDDANAFDEVDDAVVFPFYYFFSVPFGFVRGQNSKVLPKRHLAKLPGSSASLFLYCCILFVCFRPFRSLASLCRFSLNPFPSPTYGKEGGGFPPCA